MSSTCLLALPLSVGKLGEKTNEQCSSVRTETNLLLNWSVTEKLCKGSLNKCMYLHWLNRCSLLDNHLTIRSCLINFPIVPVTRKVLQTQSKYYTVCDQGVLLGILGRGVPPGSQNPDPIVRPKNYILHPFSQSDMFSKINTRFQTSPRLPIKKKFSSNDTFWLLPLLNPFFIVHSKMKLTNTIIHSLGSVEGYTRFQTRIGHNLYL